MKIQKVKAFVERNKVKLVIIGAMVGAIGGIYLYDKGWRAGVRRGVICSFEPSVEWLDNEFPTTKVLALWEEWKVLNPEKLVSK